MEMHINLSDNAVVHCNINFALFGSVALYGRRKRGQAPTLPQLNLVETYITMQ